MKVPHIQIQNCEKQAGTALAAPSLRYYARCQGKEARIVLPSCQGCPHLWLDQQLIFCILSPFPCQVPLYTPLQNTYVLTYQTIWQNKRFILFLFRYGEGGKLHMGVSASRDQKRASCPLEMELQEIMPHMKHVFWDWNSGSFSEQQDSYSLSCFHSSPNRPYLWTLHIWICNIVFCLWLFLFPNHVRRHAFIFFAICCVRPSLISFLRFTLNEYINPCPHFTLNEYINRRFALITRRGRQVRTKK